MSPAARLAGFAAICVGAFALAAGVGAAVGPIDIGGGNDHDVPHTPPTTTVHGSHEQG